MDKSYQEALKEIEKARRTNATSLDLSGSDLTTLPPEIQHLTNLQELYVSNTQLSVLPPEIQHLTKLESLWVHNTQLSVLPPEIQHLTKLQVLRVDNTHLSVLPPEIQHLTQLEYLSVSNTHLSVLPPEIQHLTKLKILSVHSTKLSGLPQKIQHLTQLKELDVRGCPIIGLPDEVKNDYKNPQRIITHLKDNVWVDQSEVQPLNEAKVLFVGDPLVGKSSIIDYMQGKPFDEHKKETEGVNIEINPYYLEVDKEKIRLNLWDFGGQVILRQTHEFFLTKRSVYILALSPRTERQQPIDYWLNLIEAQRKLAHRDCLQ